MCIVVREGPFLLCSFALLLSSHGTTRSDPVLVAIIFTGGWLTSFQADQMERKDLQVEHLFIGVT